MLVSDLPACAYRRRAGKAFFVGWAGLPPTRSTSNGIDEQAALAEFERVAETRPPYVTVAS